MVAGAVPGISDRVAAVAGAEHGVTGKVAAVAGTGPGGSGRAVAMAGTMSGRVGAVTGAESGRVSAGAVPGSSGRAAVVAGVVPGDSRGVETTAETQDTALTPSAETLTPVLTTQLTLANLYGVVGREPSKVTDGIEMPGPAEESPGVEVSPELGWFLERAKVLVPAVHFHISQVALVKQVVAHRQRLSLAKPAPFYALVMVDALATEWCVIPTVGDWLECWLLGGRLGVFKFQLD